MRVVVYNKIMSEAAGGTVGGRRESRSPGAKDVSYGLPALHGAGRAQDGRAGGFVFLDDGRALRGGPALAERAQ